MPRLFTPDLVEITRFERFYILPVSNGLALRGWLAWRRDRPIAPARGFTRKSLDGRLYALEHAASFLRRVLQVKDLGRFLTTKSFGPAHSPAPA
jgi:hypothetical protein